MIAQVLVLVLVQVWAWVGRQSHRADDLARRDLANPSF